MKNLLIPFIILSLLLSICSCNHKDLPTENHPAKCEHWMDIYYSYLTDSASLVIYPYLTDSVLELNGEMYGLWSFAYINDDTIPELILEGISWGTGSKILTIDKNEVVCIGNCYPSPRYIPLYGIVDDAGSHHGTIDGHVFLCWHGIGIELFPYSKYGIDKTVMDSCKIGTGLTLRGAEAKNFDSYFEQYVRSHYSIWERHKAKSLSINWVQSIDGAAPINTLLPTLKEKKYGDWWLGWAVPSFRQGQDV